MAASKSPMTRPRRKVKMRLRIAAVNALVSRVMSASASSAPGGRDFLGFGALVIRIAHFFPFVQQAGIDLPDHRGEIKFHLAHLVVLGRVGNGLRQHLENAVQMAQQHALGALQFVVADVIGEGTERLEHLARDGFGPDIFLARPTDAGRRRR